MRNISVYLTTLTLFLILNTNIGATNYYWAPLTNDWSGPSNWGYASAHPGTTDTAVFSSNSSYIWPTGGTITVGTVQIQGTAPFQLNALKLIANTVSDSTSNATFATAVDATNFSISNGGVVTISGVLTATAMNVGNPGTGTLNLNSAVVTDIFVNNRAQINLNGSLTDQLLVVGDASKFYAKVTQNGTVNSCGTLNLNPSVGADGDDYFLNGGLLRVRSLIAGNLASPTPGAGTIYLSGGGTIQAIASLIETTAMSLSGTNTINTSNAGVTITDKATILGNGTLLKNGSGSLVLSLYDSYTGGTIVSGGTLRLAAMNCLADGSSLKILKGATLVFDSPTFSPESVVPEPSSFVFLASGIVSIGIFVWRRKP